MKRDEFDFPVEFDSPVEFVLIGPVRGRDTVIAKSKGAGIDLIALAGDSMDYWSLGKKSDPLNSLFPKSRQVQSVRASRISDAHPASDSRTSDFVFAWSGPVAPLDAKRILLTFQAQSREIAYAAASGDRQFLEISLASVVLACSMASERRYRFRRLMIATVYLYIAIGAIVAGFGAFASYTTRYLIR